VEQKLLFAAGLDDDVDEYLDEFAAPGASAGSYIGPVRSAQDQKEVIINLPSAGAGA
jgi:hypothetical protein